MKKDVKAAVVTGVGTVEIKRFPYPKLPKGGAIVKNMLVGISGTDKHTFLGKTKHRAGLDNEYEVKFPLVQGQECVSVIEEIDESFTDYDGEALKKGDRVVVCPVSVCGKCYYCKTMPAYPWCNSKTDYFIYGETQNTDASPYIYGAQSEYLSLKKGTIVFKVPDGLPDELAAFTEPMCITYTLDKAQEFYSFSGEGFAFGSSVVIQGAGPVGIAHLIKARLLGADKIFITDTSVYRLGIAKAFGADILFNVNDTTPQERIKRVKDETYGTGADVIIDCSGAPENVPEGIEMIRIAGMYLEPGQYVNMGDTGLNVNKICAKSIRFIGMNDHSIQGYKPTMNMMNRAKNDFPWDKLFSHRFGLDDYETAIKTSLNEDSMKVLVYPNQSEVPK